MAIGIKEALLAGGIDYAGTFPPAKLPLESALKRAATFRADGTHPWLLSKMALPISVIVDLNAEALFSLAPSGAPWVFTALGEATELRGIEAELQTLRAWNRKGEVASIRHLAVSYETKLFESSVDVGEIEALLQACAASGVYPYFEFGFEGDWQTRLETLSAAMAANETLCSGIKIRTGGAKPSSPEQLAACVLVCGSKKLRFKATQGLHHPLTTAEEFGFLNLFAALSLATRFPERVNIQILVACLIEKEQTAFVFHEETFSWRDFTLSASELIAARAVHGGCFGSCSIDEPDGYLAEQFPLR